MVAAGPVALTLAIAISGIGQRGGMERRQRETAEGQRKEGANDRERRSALAQSSPQVH
jgi:hypothetical protein